jgi:branched-chain amino acid aminotransferase
MYYNENTILYYNGEFVKANEAKTDLFGQSLHYGYAVFEGIRSYNTHKGTTIFKPEAHFERLKFSCESVGIPLNYSVQQMIDISYEVLSKNNLSDAYLRPLVSCPPNMSLQKATTSMLMITAWSWGAYLGNNLLRVMTSTFQRPNPKGFKIHAKISGHYVNSIMACQEAKDNGFDEALLLDLNGNAAEGPAANLFIEKNSKLYTPSAQFILPGITRATVIEICKTLQLEVEEKAITIDDVKNADSAFYCGTAAEIIGWLSIDEVIFPLHWEESLGCIIQKAYSAKVLEQDFVMEKLNLI